MKEVAVVTETPSLISSQLVESLLGLGYRVVELDNGNDFYPDHQAK